MSKWHSEKFQKYLALIEQIKYGGWVVDFFAVEVGARGYCSTSLLTAVHKLGFSPKLQRSLIKESSKNIPNLLILYLVNSRRCFMGC